MSNPIVWFEIGCKDQAKNLEFFGKLFDWKFNAHGPAAMIDTGTKEGIGGHINALGHEPHNYVTIYVQVDDLQAYLDKAATLGGKTIVPPMPVPGMGEFAWMGTPEGSIIGLWKPTPA